MQKLLTSLAAAAALAFSVSVAQADCYQNHNVTASVAQPDETIAMSTYDGPPARPAVEDEDKAAAAAAQPACAEGDKDCAPAAE
jgi:hypothetical protein